MKLTNKQKKELECIRYFIPEEYAHNFVSSEDVQKYFEWSDHGKHKELFNQQYSAKAGDAMTEGLWALIQGKKRRDMHVAMYEEGVLEGTMPYMSLLGSVPWSVVDFLAKNLFQGIDEQHIKMCWQELSTRS